MGRFHIHFSRVFHPFLTHISTHETSYITKILFFITYEFQDAQEIYLVTFLPVLLRGCYLYPYNKIFIVNEYSYKYLLSRNGYFW